MKYYRTYDEDAVLYSNEYTQHVSAMTGEKLHSKSEIAMELAWRDIRIKELEKLNQSFAMEEYERECKKIGAPIPRQPEAN